MLEVEGLPAVVEGSRQSTMEKKVKVCTRTHVDNGHQSGSCMEASCLEFYGLNARDTGCRDQVPTTRGKETRRLGASVISWGGFSQDKRPLPRLVDWPPFALEMEGFLFCTRLGCWHGANEPRCQGRESRFEVAGGSKALQVFVSCVINPTLLAQESVQTNTINHQHQQRNKTRTLLPFSALSIFWFSPSMAPQELSCWSWAVPPLPLFSVCCLVGQSSWKHRLVVPEMRQLREMQSHGTCKGSSFQSVSTHQTLTNSCDALIL